MSRSVLISAVIVTVFALPAIAQPPDDGSLRWSLGVGVVLSPDPYVGTDSLEVRAIPALSLEYKRFYFRGITAGLELVETDRFELDWIIAQMRFDGYEEDDSSFLDGMDERELSVDGGLVARVPLGSAELELQALGDLLGRHEGFELTASLARPFQLSRQWRLTPSVGVVWGSDDLLDYYYGVRASEARPGRPAYEASAGFSPEIGIDAFYLSSGRWIWQAGLTWETFASEIEDSPIVEDSDSLSGYTFISWRF